MTYCPANSRRSPNVGSVLDQRRRRTADIEPALGKRLVFAGCPTVTYHNENNQNLPETISR